MKLPKATAIASLVPAAPHVEIKPMFGNLGAFANGNMFMGLFGSDMGVKLPEEARAELLRSPGPDPFGPEAGYVMLLANWSARGAKPWVDRAFATATAVPLKKSKRNA